MDSGSKSAVPKAQITLESDDGTPVKTTRSQADGTFAITDVPAGVKRYMEWLERT